MTFFSSGDVDIPYTVIRSRKRRRTIAISIGFDNQVRVHAPVRTSFLEIKNILNQKIGWITGKISKQRRVSFHPGSNEFEDGQSLPYLGTPMTVWVVFNAGMPRGCRFGDGVIEVNLGNGNSSSPSLAQKIRRKILVLYKMEAHRILQERIDFWAKTLNVRYRTLTLGNAKRRWGSCSPRNDIRINWRVIMAPLALVDYLLAHELCHVAHKNHSKAFWQKLESIMPDYKIRQKQLRACEPELLRRAR